MSRTRRIYNKPVNITHLYMGDTFCWAVYGYSGFHHPFRQLTNSKHQYRWYWRHPKDTPRFWRHRRRQGLRQELKKWRHKELAQV